MGGRRIRLGLGLPVLIAVVAIAAAGCGGSDSTGGSSSAAVGSTSGGGGGEGGDFADEANSACASANQQIAALGTPKGDALLEYLESTEAVIVKLHGRIEAIGATDDQQQAYLDGLAKSVTVLNEMANAARSQNLDAVRELSSGLAEFHLGQLAEEAGLDTCSEVPVRS